MSRRADGSHRPQPAHRSCDRKSATAREGASGAVGLAPSGFRLDAVVTGTSPATICIWLNDARCVCTDDTREGADAQLCASSSGGVGWTDRARCLPARPDGRVRGFAPSSNVCAGWRGVPADSRLGSPVFVGRHPSVAFPGSCITDQAVQKRMVHE